MNNENLESSLQSASPHPHPSCSQIVIPARLASTRLPRKLMLRVAGKTILQHTYEAAAQARRPNGITVAVDCQELADEVTSFGGTVFLTDPNLPSGTDRVVAVAEQHEEVDIFVNVQGDEPEISGEAIDQVIELLEQNPNASIATLATPIRDESRLHDPGCVKVVCGTDGKALYFSRSPIPFVREWNPKLLEQTPAVFLQHLGIYAYRREFLMELQSLSESPLEQLERLEQLRFLQAGASIQVGQTDHAAKGIDTRDDYEAFSTRRAA
ncbi:MAG: 3-deoxy-manno-octulosonate cytidylyltransferase [Pirellulaceae bacterium]